MPQFTVKVAEALERNGISIEQAMRDLETAEAVPQLGTRTKVVFAGRLCTYTCRKQRVFGHEDLVVESVWFE